MNQFEDENSQGEYVFTHPLGAFFRVGRLFTLESPQVFGGVFLKDLRFSDISDAYYSVKVSQQGRIRSDSSSPNLSTQSRSNRKFNTRKLPSS